MVQQCIVNNDNAEDNSIQEIEKFSHRYFWSGASGIMFALLNSCLIFCLWPQHNIFIEPSYWFEFMTVSVFGFIGLFSACFILNCSIWMHIKSITTLRNFISLYIVSAFTWVLVNITYYLIWTAVLGLRAPMPLNIHVCGITTLVVVMVAFWFLFPMEIRSSKDFSKRYCYYFSSQLFRNMCVWEYFFLGRLFVIIDPRYQWTLAIIMQIVKEVNGRILTYLCYKAASCRNSFIRITCLHEAGCRHAVFLCVALALLATNTTSFLCLGFDFAINFCLCVKIILRQRKNNVPIIRDNIELQILALNEKVVYIVPLAYCICFLLAYYGPNARIIGNVKNTSWHFGMVKNISAPLYMMLALFSIDLISILLWTFLLKKFCSISYLDGYLYIQKGMWLVMAIQEAYALNEVRNDLKYGDYLKSRKFLTHPSFFSISCDCYFLREMI